MRRPLPTLLPCLLCALMLVACNKPADAPPATVAAEAPATPAAQPASPAPAADPALADLAEQVVPQFHLAYMSAAYASIYNSAAPEMRLFQPQHEFVAYMESIRRKMGEVRGAERTSATANGMTVTLRYNSSYANGPATEEFIVRVNGKAAELLGYRMLTPSLF